MAPKPTIDGISNEPLIESAGSDFVQAQPHRRTSELEMASPRAVRKSPQGIPAPFVEEEGLSCDTLIDKQKHTYNGMFETLMASFVVAVGCFLVSIAGFCVMKESNVVVLKGVSSAWYTIYQEQKLAQTSGYTLNQFWGFAINTVLLPMTAIPLFIWLLTASKYFRGLNKMLFFGFWAAAFLTLGIGALIGYGRFWDKTQFYYNQEGGKHNKNGGYVVQQGMGLFMAGMILSTLCAWVALKGIGISLAPRFSAKVLDAILIFGFLVIFLPGCFILTWIWPVWSLNWKPSAMWRTDPMYADMDPHDGKCFWLGDIRACVYYDILHYYASIYVLCCVSLLARLVPAIRSILSKPLFMTPSFQKNVKPLTLMSALPKAETWRIGELLLLVWFAELLIYWIWFWSNHKWAGAGVNGVSVGYAPESGSWMENTSRTLGQVANLILSLLALPTSRNSIWSKMCGVSWEAMQQYHAALGYLFIIAITLHQFFWWAVYKFQNDVVLYCNFSNPSAHCTEADTKLYSKYPGQFAKWPSDILDIPSNYHADNYTTPLMVMVYIAIIICMGAGANYLVRRSNFELFYYMHHLFLVIYAAALIHASSLWPTFIVGLALWIADRLIRFTNGTKVARLSVFQARNEITELEIDALDGQECEFQEGQYAFLNIPDISAMSWHPFTIASAPHTKKLRFCIKAMGTEEGDQWTRQLYRLAEQRKPILVNVDASYGVPPHADNASLTLVLGGIGVTPGLSILDEYCHRSHGNHGANTTVNFLWTVQKYDMITPWMVGILNRAMQCQNIHVEVFFSREKVASPPPESYRFTSRVGERLSEQAMRSHLHPTTHARAGTHAVFACGPVPLVESAELVSYDMGLDFHKETFEL
jgi:predicted ferric reductase